MNRLEVARGTTALTCGLRAFGFAAGSAILVPDFVCDVVWTAVLRAGLRCVPYRIDDALVPDWGSLETAASGARAVVMVHYFGQPQDVARFRAFCDARRLALIDDNAHGYGGTFGGIPLGMFGDLGIASPRKLLGTASGGVLYYGDHLSPQSSIDDLPPFPARRPAAAIKTAIARFPRLKRRLRGLLDLRKRWSDPRLFREGDPPDFAIDRASRRRILDADWGRIAHRRRNGWKRWSEFARREGLVPLFPAVHPESSPWAFPAYAPDLQERNSWLRWGARHGAGLFPWPALPDQIIAERSSAFARWERLVCFPADGVA